MLSKIKKFLGYLWASPITLLGLLYASAFWALGWYKWAGRHSDALVWQVSEEDCPEWLRKYWKSWDGHAIGNVVVLKYLPSEIPTTLTHELKHVDQVMRLGIFQPIVYGLSFLAIKYGCPGSNPYYDNPFEIDARRAAGQVIDRVGKNNS